MGFVAIDSMYAEPTPARPFVVTGELARSFVVTGELARPFVVTGELAVVTGEIVVGPIETSASLTSTTQQQKHRQRRSPGIWNLEFGIWTLRSVGNAPYISR